VLAGLVVLLKAFAYYLDRYGLAFSERGFVNGPGFTDVNAVLPAKNILIGIALICALLCFANIVVRNILLPAGALALLVVSAVVIGGIYPAYTQQFRVNPNEIQREQPFIQRNIEATRTAYGIDDAEVTPYQASQDATPGAAARRGLAGADRPPARPERARADLRAAAAPHLLLRRQQLARHRPLRGRRRAAGLRRRAREVDIRNLASNQRSWINERLAYTHGNGLIAAPADRVDAEGRPIFVNPDSDDSPGAPRAAARLLRRAVPELLDRQHRAGRDRRPDRRVASGEVVEGEDAEPERQGTFNYDGTAACACRASATSCCTPWPTASRTCCCPTPSPTRAG
jgi:hypothetical protein